MAAKKKDGDFFLALAAKARAAPTDKAAADILSAGITEFTTPKPAPKIPSKTLRILGDIFAKHNPTYQSKSL
jgi:hypothetical protein